MGNRIASIYEANLYTDIDESSYEKNFNYSKFGFELARGSLINIVDEMYCQGPLDEEYVKESLRSLCDYFDVKFSLKEELNIERLKRHDRKASVA